MIRYKILLALLCVASTLSLQASQISTEKPLVQQSAKSILLRKYDQLRDKWAKALIISDALRKESEDLLERLRAAGIEQEAGDLAKRLQEIASDKSTKCSEVAGQSIESLEDDENPKIYKLKLPNGQALGFTQQLLEQSNFFTTLLRWHPADIEIPINEYITELRTQDPYGVSLEDLHTILSIIVANKDNPELALYKFLFAENSSLQKTMLLANISSYFDIPQLRRTIINEFAKDFNKQEYRDAIATLSDDWQREISYLGADQNDILGNFLQKYSKPQRTFNVLQAGSYYIDPRVVSASWSSNSNQLAIGSSSGVSIWNILTGNRITELLQFLHSVKAALSPSENKIALRGFGLQAWITILDLEKEKKELRIQANGDGNDDWLNPIAWSPDGKFLAASSDNHSIKVWNASTGDLLATLKGHANWVTDIAWSPDGTKLASTSYDQTIKIWTLKPEAKVTTLQGHSGTTISIAWSPDSNQVASSSGDKTIKIWNIESQNVLQNIKIKERIPTHSLSWSKDGYIAGDVGRIVKIWDPQSGLVIRTLENYEGIKGIVNVVAWAPNGSWLASCEETGKINIWTIDFELFKLTMQQIAFLEKIIQAQSLAKLNVDQAFILWSLPKEWQTLLFKAFKKIEVSKQKNWINWLYDSYHYITRKK